MAQPWTAHILTLFPDMFPGPLGFSLVGQALESGVWRLETVDIRGFARDKHRAVDDRPAGGGPGMVLRADVVGRAVDHVCGAEEARPLIYLSPRGEPLTQALVRELVAGPGVILLCGRFEGVDERVLRARNMREVSIGDYVLAGGEIAAMVMLEAVVRLLPGVLGDEASPNEESFENGLLEYPHYTRPQDWQGMRIPEVLTSGHHAKIKAWRRQQAEKITRERRPDLWARYQEAQQRRRQDRARTSGSQERDKRALDEKDE